MENPTQFNQWKDKIENINITKQIDCLRALEINLSNVCNLKCPFCPQSKNWTTNSPKFMSLEMATDIANQLHEIDFKGFLCIAGWGEPSLNPHFEEIITLFKDFQPQVITNGTQLDNETWKRITSISQVKVSVHNWNNLEWYKKKFEGTSAFFRNHDMKKPEMNLYNRAGYLNKPSEQIKRQCYLMFYKLTIDTNGKYVQCEADWERNSETSWDIYNINIKDYFENCINDRRRKMLSENGRQSFECCKYCDINGQMIGEKFVDYWRKNNGC